jgi:Protein of unknown function (DUF3313)
MRPICLTALAATALALASCATTDEGSAKDIKFSGFLGDYSDLKKGTGGQPDYVYVMPGINLAPYTRIMIDPPQAWVTSAQREKLGEKDLSYLLTSLDKAYRDALGAKWELVDRPAADVIRIRLAIDNAHGDIGVLTPFSRILPWGLVAEEGVKVTTGSYLNDGSITAEEEILDGGTGKRLAAAVDSRTGGNSVTNVFSNWGDVKDACSYWANKNVQRLMDWGMKPTK